MKFISETSLTAYYVSKEGEVISVNKKSGKEIVMAQRIDTKGYARVNIARKTHNIHRLVAAAFHPNPKGLSDVDHKDENKLNNKASNLQWLSSEDNIKKHQRLTNPNYGNPRVLINGKPYTSTGSAARFILKDSGRDVKIETIASNLSCVVKGRKNEYTMYGKYKITRIK